MKKQNKKDSEPRKKSKGKNALLGDIARKTVGKIVEKIRKKKPFGGKGGRRKKEPEQIQQPTEEQQDLDQSCFDAETYENGTESTGGLFNDFFYVNDGFIARFEDDDILKHIQKKFPQFNPGKQGETALRNAVIKLLSDSDFMEELLGKYSMTIFDFFKFLFRMDSSIYKGSFVQKIQKTIKRRKYAAVKQHRYSFQKQVKRSRRIPKRA